MVQVQTDGNSHPFHFMPRIKINWVSPVAQIVKNLSAGQETQIQNLGWKIPWRRESQPKLKYTQFSSVAQSYPTLRPHGLQHARLPYPSPTPGVHPNPCPLSQWCHPTISSSVIPVSCPQSFPASGSFPMSQLFIEKSKSKLWDTTSHQSEWPSLKRLQMKNSGESVEKREPSHTVGGNINLCSHYGKQYGGYSNN